MDSENSKRNSLPNSQSLPNIQSGLKVPFQAIIAMKDLEELKKKYGNQRGNSYQQGGLKRKLKSFSIMKGKKSLEKNQIPSNVKERSFINVVKNTENLKILDQDYLNYEHEKMEIANVKKKQEKVSVVGSPQFKINAQQFQSRKFDNIQKQTLGIHSLMLDSQQRQIKFPKINKMQSDDQFLSLMEKSIKTQRETEDLLQNISRIIAGPGLGEQTSLFEDKQNLNFSISKTSDKNSILRKNQSEIFFQVNNNQQATEEDEHFQNQLINIINDQSNQEYWSEQSNFKDQKQRNINLHALEIQDMSVIHSNTKNKKDSIFQNMLSLFNRKSIQPLDYTPSNIRKKNISLGNQQSISLKDSKHINLSPQNNTSKLIEDSVIQGSILNEDSLGNDFNDIFHQQPRGINQTFEDDFCDPTLLLEPLEEQDSNILNINIPHKNNFRIEPLDQYDEYALQDANFKEMLSAGPQQAMSRWQDKNGKVFWKNCIVLDYNEQTKFFTIQWSNIQKAKYKKVKRLNLMFYFDDPAEYKKRYRAAVKKREEFLLNQQLTQHIDQKQGQETMSLPIDRLSQTIDCILENHENKEEKKEKIMKEVVGLYKFQLVKFDTEFEAVRYDVNSYYQKYLPYLSANNFVNKLPLKDKEKFEFQEVGQESGCLKQQITRYITNKPHLVQDKNNLKLFSWVEFGNKNKLNIQEVASLQISQVMLGFISSIESLDYFKQFKTFKKTIQASSFEINKNYTQEFMRAIEQIDRLAYKVEKGIDEMKIDFQPQLCIESSKLLFSLSNKLIKNAIEKSFKRSTAQLIEQLDKFYAFLPLPEIGIKVIKKLPEQFFIKRTQQRKQMLLDTDQQVEDRLFKLQLNFISNIQQKRESSLFVNSNEQNSASSPQNNSKDAKKQDSNLFITSQNSKKQIDSQRLSEIPAKLNLQLQQLSNEQTLQQQQQQIQQLASKGVEESLHAIIFPIYKNLQSQDRQIINSIAQALQNQFLENQKPLIQLNFINPNLNGLPQFAKYEIEWVLNKEIKTEKRNYEQRKKQRKKYREIFYSQNETSEIVLIKQNIQQKEDKKLVNRGNKVTNNQNEDFQTENKMDEYESITKGRFDFINFQYLVTTTSPSLNSLEKLIKESFKIPLEKINMLYQIGSQETVLFESEEFKIDSEGVKSSIQEIIPWSFYGIYAFLILINSFSFHFTQKRYYIQDIQSEFDKKSLGLYFFCEEINILEKDLMFFRIGLPNYLNFGFILLKTETLKQEYIQQIKFYINQLKKIIQDKLVSQLQATRQQVQNFTERLQKNPATIKDYSEISDYLSSQAILEQYTDLQTQINYINDLMKVCDEYSLEISFETIQMQVESRSWILQLRNIEQEQLKKLYQIKPKFEKTLKESIANLLTNFEKQKKLSDELKQQGSLDNIYVLSSQTKSLKNQLDEIYQKAQELNQFENYLKMSPITNFCEIEICLNDLMKYYDLWDFAERWKLRYEEWTTRPLVFMESKEVVDTLNEGFQLLPDLILDFKDNPLFITIIKQLEEEIQKFNNIELELQKIEGILKDTFLRTLPYYLDVTSEFTFKIIKNTSDVIKNLSEAKFRSNILIKNLSFIDVFKKRMHSVHKLARNGKKVIKIMSKVQNTLLDYISLFIQFQQYENTKINEILLLDDKINIDISKGIENAIDGQMKLEESMRYLLRKQFLKNTQTLTRLGLDYNEIYRLLHLKNEIIFQIAYLNIDICFYHDLTTTILNSEENDEVPDLNLLDFLQKIRMYMHNFINNQMQMGLTKNELLKFSGLVMQSLNHQNILQRFIDQKVDTLASFDYLGLPKFSVEVETNQILRILQQNKHNSAQNPLLQLNQQEIIQHMLKSAKLALDNRESTDYPNLSENSEFFYYFSLIDNPQLINVNLMCMNYKRGYTWEFIAGDHYTFVNTYQTERMLFNIIGAISTNTSILIRGPQSSGKQSTVSYLATILAKPYFTWKFSDQNDFSSLNQVLIGTAQGGYITLIQNCEYLNVGMISTLANIIFQIRNSCISKIDILDSNNCPIKVSEHWGLYASFTVRQDSQVLQFSQIPNILESFRTVSIVQPDIQTILAAKLTLMNFIRPIETAQRLHVFFQLLSSSLSNSHFLVDSFKQLDVITLDQVSQTEFNQHLFNPNTSTIMKIISHAEYFLFEKKVSNEDEIENYTLLYSAINTYYAHALSQFHLKLLNNLFIKCKQKLVFFIVILSFINIPVFPESQVSEGYLFKDFQDDGANEEEEANEGKQKTVQILQTPQVSSSALHQNKDDNQDDDFEHHVIDYFQKVHKVKPSERFIDTILDMIFNININKTILVVGLNSKVKDYALNAAAYVSSLFEKAQFYKHYITLDANDYTFLMGEHIDGVWRKGILQQLLDSITYMSENGLYSEVLNQYYRSNYLNFITSQANPLDNQNKIQNLQSKSIESNVFLKKNQQGKTKNPQTILTLKDWIIFETSNTNFKGNQSKFIDQMIKSIHQRILFFDNGQQIQLQSTLKLILNLDSLDNITPGCLGNFQIFNFGYNNYVQKNQSFAGNNIVSQGFNWSIKNDFESWLDTLISKNKFFNYCEKILRTCYVYLFEPILVFLKDSLEQTSSGEAKKLFNNPGAIVDIILHQQQNFLSLLEIFMNEFRKTMVALGKYAITSNSSTMKDVRSKAFYTFISLQNKKQASPVKNADLNDSQHQLNTDASYLEKEFRAPVESIFLFSIVQGMCSSYINPNFLSQLTEHCLGCVKKLKLAHENIFSSQFKACQNLSKLLKQNKSLSVLDLIYDISELAWVRISEFQIPENIPLLDSSLSNDHLELSEIVRLNKNALQVEEMKKLMENNQEIVYQLPTHEKQVVYLSAPFKTTKYLIDYLMGYKKNIFVYSTPQAGKTKLFQYLERQHLVKNTYKINVIQLLRNTKIGQFQQFVENSLSFKNFQTKQSEIGKCSYAFIDDLNFVSLEGPNIIGCLRSLIAHGGWISQQKNRFLRFENCNVICNYSSRKLFSEDFSKFAELGSCLREMFMLKFPDMNGDHLTGIFMEILKTSPMFNTKEKMQANILAADILQKQLAKFAHNYMSSIPKLTQITQIFKINFNISKVLTLITSTLSHQQIVQNGQLNESFFEQMWTYILDACFLDSLPWNKNPIFLEKLKSSQKTNAKNQFIFNLLKDSLSDSGSDEEFDNIQQNSPLKKGSLSMNQNYNIPNLSLHTEGQQSQNKAIEIQHFLVETLYSPKKTKKTVETKGLVKLGQINRVRMSKQVNIEIERQYFKLENIDQFENRTRFLNQYFTQKIDKGQESLLKQLQKLSEQKFQKFPAKIHKFFIKTMSYYYEDEKINKSNLDKTKKIYVPHNLTNSQLSNGQASLLKIENLNFSQLNIEQDQNRFMHNMSDRDQFYFIHEDQNNFISYLQNKLLEYLFQPPQQKYEIQASKNQKEGNGAQNEKEIINDYFNIHAYWDIQIQQGGVENILGDLSAILNNIYIMKQNISLYTPTSKSELIKFISYLMGSNCIIIKISSENCVSVLLQTILDILKGMIEGNPVHTLVQFTISDLKSKEFKRIFEIFQIIKIIIQNSNLEGIFSQKQLKQLLEPWKQSQVKKVTTLQQMEINVSEKDIKSKLGGFKPNLVENHMIYILRQKLKDYISFIIEINPDNYKEYLILKDQIPKSFTHFNDHFSFLQKSNQKKNSSEQDDINKLINEPTMQEIQNKFWQAEKGVSELFEINYFQTSIKSQKEIEFFVPHLARLIQNNLQSTITQISSKKNVSQIINIDMIKQPINDKLKQLLEELLNYKMKYIDIKKQYENLQKLHETQKNFSSYKMNYSKLQINHEKDKVQREGKRKSSINNHLYNPNDQKLIQSEHQSIQTNKMINQSNLSSRRFNRSGSNDIHQSQDEQKMMESHRIYLEEIKDDKNEILHKLETAKKSYQNAFKNFRYINLLLCQLLKTIHYFRQECNPILTFQEGELAKYAYDIALYSLSALKYPSCYRENLFDVLLQQNKKLNIPFYKILLDSPTAYLEQLINGTDLGINIINEYSLINFLIGVDLLPLCITDETGGYLQYLQNVCIQKQKRSMHIEYNTVDEDSLENVENAILKGSYLVLHNPDETLVDLIQPILQFKYKNLIKSLIQFKNLQNQQKLDELFTFNQKRIKLHSQFRLIMITSSYSSFLIKSFNASSIFVHLSFQDKKFFSSFVYDNILNTFYQAEKQKLIKGEIFKRDILSKQDYSLERILPIILKLSLSEKDSWNPLIQLLPHHIINQAAAKEGFTDNFGEDDQLLQIGQISNELIMKNLEDTEKDQLMLNFQNAELRNSIDLEKSNSSMGSKQGELSKQSKNFKEIYGDVSLHSQIGQHLQNMKEEDEELKTSQYQRQSSFKRQQTLKEKSSQIKRQNTVFSQVSQTESEAMASSNDLENNLPQYCFFNFEILDFQSNNSLSPEYPSQKLVNIASKFKILVEILYGLKLSYKEVVTQIEKEDSSIKYSEENFLLVFKQVSDCLKLNQFNNIQTNQFNKRFASMSYHYLYCTLREDHQTVWQLTLSFFFQMSALTDKKQINYTYLQQKVLLEQRIKPIQNLVFSKLSTNRYWDSFITSLVDLYGSYDNLIAPLINFSYQFEEKIMNNQEKSKIIKNIHNQFKQLNQIRRDSINKVTEQKSLASQQLMQKSSFYSKKNIIQEFSLEKIEESNSSQANFFKRKDHFKAQNSEEIKVEQSQECNQDSNSDQNVDGDQSQDIEKEIKQENEQLKQQNKNQQQSEIIDSLNSENQISNQKQTIKQIETETPSLNEVQNTYQKLMDGPISDEDEFEENKQLNIVLENQEDKQKITRAMSEYYYNQGNQVIKKEPEQNKFLESIVEFIDDGLLEQGINIISKNKQDEDQNLIKQDTLISKKMSSIDELEQDKPAIQSQLINDETNDQNNQNQDPSKKQDNQQNLEDGVQKVLAQISSDNVTVNKINLLLLQQSQSDNQDESQTQDIGQQVISTEQNNVKQQNIKLDEIKISSKQNQNLLQSNNEDQSYLENSPARSKQHSVCSSLMDSPNDYMVKEEDFNSPLPQKQNQMKILQQSNFLIQFKEQNRISQQIIDIPNVRNQDVQDKDYMLRMEQEFNLNTELGGQSTKENVSQKQFKLQNKEKPSYQAQEQHESTAKNKENKSYMSQEINQFNMIDRMDSIIQLAKENNYIKRPALGLPLIKSKFDNLRYDNDLMWFGINSYKAIFHSSQVLGSKELQNTLTSLQIEKDLWKSMFFLSHSQILRDDNNYIEKMKEKLGDINMSIFLKFFRPDILENIINVHLTKQLSKFFISHTKTNLNAHSRANWYNKPTVIFYGHLNKTINELLELKACKQSQTIKVKRIPLGSISNKIIKQELSNASIKGDWIVLENIKSVPYDQLGQLIKIINNALNSNQNKNEYFKVWITQQQMNKSYQLNENSGIVQTHRKNSQTLLQQFFFNCFKMFINRPDNIKNNLSVLYTLEIHEYLAFVEKKVTQTLPTNYNFSTLGKQLQSPIHEAIKYRFQKQKRHENINYSYNIHSVFIDRIALREKNKHAVNILEKFSNKIKFNIFFIFSILRSRQKYHRKIAEYYQQSELLFFSDLDLLYVVEDGFHFLNYYSINPSLFFRNYLKLIFSEEMPYNAHSTWTIASMRDLLEELVFKAVDKQTIYTSGDQKYTLFFEQPHQSTEETIFKTINDLPNLDSPQTIEISPNTEIQYGFNRSQRLMSRIHKKVQLQEQLGKEAEMLRELKDQIAYTSEDKESLSDVSLVSTNDKNLQLDDSDDFTLQQVGQIYAYWINHIDLLGKNMTIIQKIQQIQNEFKILFEKSQNLDLFSSKFAKHDIQEENDSDSDSSSDMSEDQNIQQAKLSKISKNGFQIKLRKNKDSDSSFDSSFSDSKNEQENQYQKGKSVSPKNQSFVDDHYLKKDLQKWFSDKPLHAAPVISRKSNLLNSIEKSETQLSTNRLSSPKIKSSLRQPSIANIMLGNLQSSPQLNLKMNHRISVAAIASPHRQSVFFGKQFIVENTSNTLSPNLNSPSKNSHQQSLQSPPTVSSPLFHPRKESIFVKLPNTIGQNLIRVNAQEQLSSNRVSDSVQLFSLQTNQPKDGNQPVYNSTLQNELQIAKSLLKRIITDLDDVIQYVLYRQSSFSQQEKSLLQTGFLKTSEQEAILINILENKVPQNWWIQSFLIRENDLQQYMKYLILKLETLKLILEERRCKMYPVIQLDQMFDPFFLISSYLTHKSTELNMSIFDLKIECEIQNKPSVQQPTDGSMLINGFFIKNGRLNEHALDIEHPREFEYKIPNMKIMVKKKIYKNNFFKNYPAHMSMNFVDDSLYDFEGTYYAQNQFINGTKKVQKSEFVGKKTSNDSKQYVVRLPVVNSLTNHLFNSFPMRIYFYFRSSKPQEFWVKRSTEIYLQQEFL
ncbi:hypothetical protein ABPG72_007873 [Tetrahymena utriculariae]